MRKSEEEQMREYYEEIIRESEAHLYSLEKENDTSYDLLLNTINVLKEKWNELS